MLVLYTSVLRNVMQEMVLMLAKKKSQKTGFSLITRTENDIFIILFLPSKKIKHKQIKQNTPNPTEIAIWISCTLCCLNLFYIFLLIFHINTKVEALTIKNWIVVYELTLFFCTFFSFIVVCDVLSFSSWCWYSL